MHEEEKRKVLIEEFNQAWQHYRHLEETRAKYFNFFLTATFAVPTLFVGVININSAALYDHRFMIAAIYLLLFNVFTTFIYINIIRIGQVRNAYEKVFKQIRLHIFKDESQIPNKISVRDHLPKDKYHTIQFSAGTLLIFSMICIDVSSAFLIFYIDEFNFLIKLFSFLILALIMILQYFLIKWHRKNYE